MLLDALHAVAVLLLGGPQVLLQGPGHRGEDGLRCLSRVHHVPRRLFLLFFLHAFYVGEGLLYRHHQAGRRQQREFPLVRICASFQTQQQPAAARLTVLSACGRACRAQPLRSTAHCGWCLCVGLRRRSLLWTGSVRDLLLHCSQDLQSQIQIWLLSKRTSQVKRR